MRDSLAKTARMTRIGALALALSCAACGAVYPEIKTPVRPAPEGKQLSPPPPKDALYLAFESATIPETTRDGRRWDAVGGSAPDPFAKLFLDGEEILRTPVQSNTLTPTWPDSFKGNYRVPKGSVLRVELWDENPINNHPICVREIKHPQAEAQVGSVDIDCDSGAKMRLLIQPAKAKLGVGFDYELRTLDVYVTRVVQESPAAHAGVKPGDQIVRIQGKEVRKMEDGEAKSLINTNAQVGLNLTLKHADGSVVDVTLKDGPIYPLRSEDIPVE